MNGKTLRYGIIGGGFISEFQLRALVSVRGVEVAGLFSRSPPERLAKFVRDNGLGAGTIYKTIGEIARNFDVLAFFGPNFTRVAALEEAAQAVAAGAKLNGLIIEKPLARNLAEADRVMALAKQIGAPTAYFENQIHMKSVQNALRAAARRDRRDGAARARALGRGARRSAQRLVLGSDAAGRRRAVRHGLPLHRAVVVRADAARQVADVSRAAIGHRARGAAEVGTAALPRRTAREARRRLREDAGRGFRDRASSRILNPETGSA